MNRQHTATNIASHHTGQHTSQDSRQDSRQIAAELAELTLADPPGHRAREQQAPSRDERSLTDIATGHNGRDRHDAKQNTHERHDTHNGHTRHNGHERPELGDVAGLVTEVVTDVVQVMFEESSEDRQQVLSQLVAALERLRGETQSVRALVYAGGAGSDCLYLSESCRQVAYCEEDERLWEVASERFTDQNAAILRIARTATYGPDFDAVICLNTALRFPDPRAALVEMARLTKPGGLLVLGGLRDAFDVRDSVTDEAIDQRAIAVEDAETDAETVDGTEITDEAAGLVALLEHAGCRQIDALEQGEQDVRIFAKGPAVTVVVPVYNALGHTSELIASIHRTHPGYPVQWRFVNDGSPDPGIAALLDEFAAEEPQTRTADNREFNVGFVQTCNAGMRASGSDDVILLNSDTIVYDGWVRKLVEAAYEAKDIGTVTPLSNNASAFSMFKGIAPENNLNAMLAESERAPLDIPTGVGFCLYIKREILDKLGFFDSIFERGYGEETDLCQRVIKAGYRNILTPKVFIYHAGGASMVAAGVLAAGQITLQEHEDIINRRYPDYVARVQEFIASGIIDRLGQELARAYVARESTLRQSVAMVTHTNVFGEFVGGTEYHIRDVVRELAADHVFYALSPSADGVRVAGAVDGALATIEWRSDDYDALLRDLNPGLIHIHHLMSYSPAFVDALSQWTGAKVFTIHDYHGLCPRYTLLNKRLDFCGVPAKEECDRCAADLFPSGGLAVERQRAMHQQLLDSVDLVIAPSRAAAEVFRRGIVVDEERVRVVAHPVPLESYVPKGRALPVVQPVPTRSRSRHTIVTETPKLTVGFIGYNADHKGGNLIKSIITACRGEWMRFVAIGEIVQGLEDAENVTSTGLYARDEVLDLIEEHGIDIMIIASPWPETYCYTLSEAWEAGVPAIVGPLGAPAERVAASGAGLVMSDYHVDTFVSTLRALAKDRGQLGRLKHAVANVQVTETFDEYRELYASLMRQVPSQSRVFSSAGGSTAMIQGAPPSETMLPPIVVQLVNVRKRIFPVGSRRERMYFRLHNLVTPHYAGGVVH